MSCLRMLIALLSTLSVALAETLVSPDGNIHVETGLESGRPFYQVVRNGDKVLDRSFIGIKATSTDGDLVCTAEDWEKLMVTYRQIHTTWKPAVGKRSLVRDHCHEMTMHLGSSKADRIRLNVVFRAYDEGIAFRYLLEPEPAVNEWPTIRITGDQTEFAFVDDHQAWSYRHENRPFGPDRLTALTGRKGYPVVMRSDAGYWLAIAEAALTGVDYFDVVFSGQDLTARLHVDPSLIALPFKTPWRVLMLADDPKSFLDSDLLVNLSPPPFGDFTWVKPGLSVWDWRVWGFQAPDGFEYEMGFPAWKRMIDFASDQGIPYLLLDANWYGPEHSDLSNPFQGGLAAQVRQALDYGKQQNVGLILYLNDAASRNFQIEEIVAAYARWGAAGIKYGFMKGSGQEKVIKTERIVRACAENKLLVNFHDGPIPPTGHERTWPNWNTREYIHAQTDGHRTHLPGDFVHMAYVQALVGPVDGNHGLFDYESTGTERPPSFGGLYSTIVAEVARTLILYSGLTVLPDAPEAYQKYPDIFRFIKAQVQPWQQSRTLQGEFGKWITTMRQSAEGRYLVATATDEEPRRVKIPLDFLPPGPFKATVFSDAEDAHYRDNRVAYDIRVLEVTAKNTIHAKLAPGGGHAILLSPNFACPDEHRLDL